MTQNDSELTVHGGLSVSGMMKMLLAAVWFGPERLTLAAISNAQLDVFKKKGVRAATLKTQCGTVLL